MDEPASGTQYSLRALPIGGFCAMEGEDNKISEAEQQREFRAGSQRADCNFQAKSPWSRLAIILAGPIANFVLCYLILLVGALAFGVASDKSQSARRRRSLAGSPAAIAGIRPGDRIVAIDNVPITSGKSLVDTIHASLGKRLDWSTSATACATKCTSRRARVPPPVGRSSGCIGFSPVPAFERVGFCEAVRESGERVRGHRATRRSTASGCW